MSITSGGGHVKQGHLPARRPGQAAAACKAARRQDGEAASLTLPLAGSPQADSDCKPEVSLPLPNAHSTATSVRRALAMSLSAPLWFRLILKTVRTEKRRRMV